MPKYIHKPTGTLVESGRPLSSVLYEPVGKGDAPLSELTVAQLRDLCGARGIEAPKRATKTQLVSLLEE